MRIIGGRQIGLLFPPVVHQLNHKILFIDDLKNFASINQILALQSEDC